MERLTERFSDGKAFIKPSIASLTTGMNQVIQRLASYEDAEEQGLLLRLPCKVGDTVYAEELGFVISEPISKFEIFDDAICCYGNHYRYLGVYGRSVFKIYMVCGSEDTDIYCKTTVDEVAEQLKAGGVE